MRILRKSKYLDTVYIFFLIFKLFIQILIFQAIRAMIGFYTNRDSGLMINPNIFYLKGIEKHKEAINRSDDSVVAKTLLSVSKYKKKKHIF